MSIKVKQLNIKEAISINEYLDKKEKEDLEETPIYKKLYPPLKDLFIYDENNEINNNLLKIKSKIAKAPAKTNFLKEEEEENDDMTEDFLMDLVKNPCPISKIKVVDKVSKFIQKSKLIEKLETDYQSDKKITSNSLSKICAERLTFEELQPGEIVFKIGDAGDRFYFILRGNISILKLKEIPKVTMTYIQYIKYCLFLLNSNEEYLLNEVIKANDSVLNLSSIEDIKIINKIIFMRQLTENINKTILNNNNLKSYFEQNGQVFEDYDIKREELDLLEQQKSKGIQGAGKEWENYIIKRIKPTVSEQVFFQPYENILTDNQPKKIRCFCYHSFLYLGPGLFFGDTALDFENNKRNATIRAEEYTILGYLKREDYLSIISPKNKIEKLKELEFIYENFFFKGINPHIFEKNYFHLFSPREYYRGSILFSNGTIPRSLILLQYGRISLELKASVIDIHNLIKFTYNNILTNPIYSKLSQGNKNKYLPNEKLSIIKNYINDPILTRLKMHNNRFIEEMNVVRNYQIKNLTDNESMGLEEIFLRLPYLMKSIVLSEKIYCYEIALEHIDKMLNIGKDILYDYLKFSINKVLSLIERLQNIKQNSINMSLVKYEKEMLKGGNSLNNGNNDPNFKNKIEDNKKNEKALKKMSRNKKYKNKDINNTEKENNYENKNNYSTIKNQSTSSPIKLFVTNINNKSKLMFEKLKLTYKKIQKRHYMNSTKNISPIFKQPISLSKSIKTNNKNDSFFKTVEINKIFSYDSKQKDNQQTSYINNIKSNIQRKNTDEKIETTKTITDSDSSINNKYKDEIIYNISSKNNLKFKNAFNLSYIPLDLMCINNNNNILQRNIPLISPNINEIINESKRKIDLNILKKSYSTLYDNNSVNNSNNNSIIKNFKKQNNFSKEFRNKLNIIANKERSKNNIKEKNMEKSMKVINKKTLISNIVKDFYKGIRLNGYSSFIHNKDMNTVFMRKYNKKYDSAEKVSNKVKNHLLRVSDSLPFIA